MASSIITSVVTGGTNSHATTSYEANSLATDFITQGVNGTIGNTSGVAPATGSFAVNAQGTPAMFVDVTAGTGYITATPSGQASQNLRAYMASNYTSYAISSNATGSTKYDWVYLKVDPTKAGGTEDAAADDVTALFTSRSSSNSVDNGTPPTYGILLAVVTVANGASSITNGNIADSRTNSTLASPAGLAASITNNTFDHVVSGCVWSGDSYASTLNGSMTAGTVQIGGKPIAVALVTAHAFTASKDTYIDVDNTGTITYTAVTNNAASPALAANSIRLAIVISGASSIAAATSVNQGQETMVLPIASSIPYAVTDSLGNLICPRDPNRRVLGYRRITTNFTTANNGIETTVPGLTVPFIAPGNRRVKVKILAYLKTTAAAATAVTASVMESSTYLAQGTINEPVAGYNTNASAEDYTTPSAGLHTYLGSVYQSGAGTITLEGGTGSANGYSPCWVSVELV